MNQLQRNGKMNTVELPYWMYLQLSMSSSLKDMLFWWQFCWDVCLW